MDFQIPVGSVGAGTQPGEEDGTELDIMTMPQEMATYSMPELAESITALEQANRVLLEVQTLLDAYQPGRHGAAVDLARLDADNRELIDQVMGEGEVSVLVAGTRPVRIQEAVLAGVWRVQYLDELGEVVGDFIEVDDIPAVVRQQTFAGAEIQTQVDKQDCPVGVNNAIPLVTELNARIAVSDEQAEPYVINLTLLPQSDEDIEFLKQRLGTGTVTVLSRGYGNCRVSSTATKNVWWVQYFNAQDAIILNTLEVTPVPVVVCAAIEDIEDSAGRLREIREVYA